MPGSYPMPEFMIVLWAYLRLYTYLLQTPLSLWIHIWYFLTIDKKHHVFKFYNTLTSFKNKKLSIYVHVTFITLLFFKLGTDCVNIFSKIRGLWYYFNIDRNSSRNSNKGTIVEIVDWMRKKRSTTK